MKYARAVIVIQFTDPTERVVNVSFADIDAQLHDHGDPQNVLVTINAHPPLIASVRAALEPAPITHIRIIDVRDNAAYTHIVKAEHDDHCALCHLLKRGATRVQTLMGAHPINEQGSGGTALVA